MKEPEVVTGKAVGTIGDATLYGHVNKLGLEVTFTGIRIKMKRPVKSIYKTLQNRLLKGVKLTIETERGLKWSTDKGWVHTRSNLIYGDRGTRIGFTLLKDKE